MPVMPNQEQNLQPTGIPQPLKWHGGKRYLADRIVSMLPPHIHYVEPYFGGGAVLWAKPPELIENHSEVVNDIHGTLMNFWLVLQDENLFHQFCAKCRFTPLSEEIWEQCYHKMDDPSQNRTERAWSFFVANRQSRQGMFRTFATLSRRRCRRGMNEQVASWLSAVEGLEDAHGRLRRVVILNRDALAVIRQQDGPDTAFYLDPPYIQDTRTLREAYQHEMSIEQHTQLLQLLAGLQGRFILSGYDHPLYRWWQGECGWRCTEIKIDNKASSATVKPIMTECLWINY